VSLPIEKIRPFTRDYFLFIPFLACFILFLNVAKLISYGLDLTDEGFYLNWISAPWIYETSVTQFGFIYHPLWRLADGDLVLFRTMSLALTFILFFCSIHASLTVQASPLSFFAPEKFYLLGFALFSLLTFGYWMPTPNYNTLNLQSLLIVISGFFWAQSATSRTRKLGWAMIGLGGFLCFMAKPPSAALLGLVLGLALCFSRRLKWADAPFSALTAVLFLAAFVWMVDGSVAKFFYRLYEDYRDSKLLAGDRLDFLIRLYPFKMNLREALCWCLVFAVTLGSSFCISHREVGLRRLGALIVAAIFLLSVYCILRREALGLSQTPFVCLIATAPTVAILAWRSLLCRDGRAVGPVEASSSFFNAAFILAMVPVYIFGTNTHKWGAIGSAMPLFTLATIAMYPRFETAEILRKHLRGLASLSLLVATVCLNVGLKTPYRQTGPVYEFRAELRPRSDSKPVLVRAELARYVSQVREQAESSGFLEGTSLIDLTGRAPGLVYLLGGRAIGAPWMYGGYPGSVATAVQVLKRLPCAQVSAAWILTEPLGPRAIDGGALAPFGLSLVEDYLEVATLPALEAKGAAAISKRYLLKPKNSLKSLSECVP